MDETVAAIARRLSGQLLEQGAKATLLTGSQARGTARPQSDIDIFAIGDGPEASKEGAFAANGEDARESAAGALTLYAFLVEDAEQLFDDRQREVVERALGVTDRWRQSATQSRVT